MKLIDLTPVMLALLTLMASIITIKIIPVLKEKLSTSQRETILAWVKIAVKAAEQLCKDGRLDPLGRKDYVIKYVIEILEKNGFTIDLKEIENMLEAIVSDLPDTFIKKADNENVRLY